MNRWQCWLKGVWRSIRSLLNSGFPMSGHDYVDTDEFKNVLVTISKCETCGDVNTSWGRQ